MFFPSSATSMCDVFMMAGQGSGSRDQSIPLEIFKGFRVSGLGCVEGVRVLGSIMDLSWLSFWGFHRIPKGFCRGT